jgi:hypothetical protein
MRRFYGIAMAVLFSGAGFAAELVRSEVKVVSAYATNGSHWGSMVALDGERLAAATRNFQGNTNYVEVFGRSGSGWSSEAVFGFAGTNVVESIDLSGDRLVVGIDLPGEVRVYERGAAGWALADTVEFAEGRGARASLHGGVLAVLMGSSEQKGGGTFIYELEGGEWTERFATNRSGAVVDTDGETVVVGSPTDPRLGAGSVMVYSREGGVWHAEARIPAPDFMLIPFGTAVAVEGERLVVGASFGRFNEGEALVYRKTEAGYVEETVLGSGVTQDFFGQSVAISGGTIAVGARLGNREQGAVYLFRQKDGKWERTELLPSIDAGGVGDFGAAVALDGNGLAVGAPDSRTDAMVTDGGVVMVYELAAEGPVIRSVRWQAGQGGGFVLELEIAELNQPHRIEYKTSLGDGEWQTLIEFVADSRQVTSLDATATNAMRFYRVVRETISF